jgi:nitrate/nitrite transporter NarK
MPGALPPFCFGIGRPKTMKVRSITCDAATYTAFGVVEVMGAVANTFGNIYMGYLRDVTGSYTADILSILAFSVLCFVLMLAVCFGDEIMKPRTGSLKGFMQVPGAADNSKGLAVSPSEAELQLAVEVQLD